MVLREMRVRDEATQRANRGARLRTPLMALTTTASSVNAWTFYTVIAHAGVMGNRAIDTLMRLFSSVTTPLPTRLISGKA